jgi:hypothetical protein
MARKSHLRMNGLSIVIFALMLGALIGQILSGHTVNNHDLAQNGAMTLTLTQYLLSGHFLSATFENWESEFLQMGMYIVLSAYLHQIGSAESRPLDPEMEQERVEPGDIPWPVKRGGIWLKLYENSLAIAFGALFLISFALHLGGSWRHELLQRQFYGDPAITIWQHLGSSQFWFESFQNWQSEFLAVAALVILTIWLRQKDSPQSKPVHAPHSQTGT